MRSLVLLLLCLACGGIDTDPRTIPPPPEMDGSSGSDGSHDVVVVAGSGGQPVASGGSVTISQSGGGAGGFTGCSADGGCTAGSGGVSAGGGGMAGMGGAPESAGNAGAAGAGGCPPFTCLTPAQCDGPDITSSYGPPMYLPHNPGEPVCFTSLRTCYHTGSITLACIPAECWWTTEKTCL